MAQSKSRFDNVGIGFFIGMLLPVLVFFVVFLMDENGNSFSEYMNGLWHLHVLVKLGSLCVFANVGVFWIFLQKKYEKAARGVLGATILYAFAVLISRAI